MDVGVGQNDFRYHCLCRLAGMVSVQTITCFMVQLLACRRNVEGQLGQGTQLQDAAATPVAVDAFASSQVCLLP